MQELSTPGSDAEFATEDSAITWGSGLFKVTEMNFKTLVTDFTKNLGRPDVCWFADPEAESIYIVDPAQCGWIACRDFNGPMGLICAVVVLFLLAAVIGFALYARQ